MTSLLLVGIPKGFGKIFGYGIAYSSATVIEPLKWKQFDTY